MNSIYTAKTQYTNEKVKRLAKVICGTYGIVQKLVLYMLGLSLIAGGMYYRQSQVLSLALLFFGAIFFTNANYSEKQLTKDFLSAVDGKYITIAFNFYEDSFSALVNDTKNKYNYSDLIRLVEDKENIFIFANERICFMIEKKSIMPDNAAVFKEFLAERTYLHWTEYRPWFSRGGLRAIFENIRNSRR